MDSSVAVAFEHVSLAFDDHVVLRDLSFTVPSGAMRILFGASGAGKSVILKMILGLIKPDEGKVYVNGQRVDTMSEVDLLKMREDIGMVFQEMALFDSLTVGDNVGFRLDEEARLSIGEVRTRVDEVLRFVGLSEMYERMPSELSGGQRRRVAIARAITARPDLLLFDDPITGLDPLIAISVDDEIIKLRDLQHATTLLVTHQIRDAFYIAQHEAKSENGVVRIVPASKEKIDQVEFLVLLDGRIHFQGSADELLASEDAYLKEYLLDTLPPW